MNKKKLKKTLSNIGVASLAVGIAIAVSGCKTTGSCGASSCGKSVEEGKSSCGKGSCGKGSCGK